MNRRQFFTNFAKGATCSISGSPGPEYYTNAVFRTQENKEVRFYDDLLKNKHVVINFMYTRCEGSCPITTANLVKVQDALKKRIGRDIYMYSITLKPEEDDPATLKQYAQMYRTKPGWLFLTGKQQDIDTLRLRLLSEHHPGIDLNPNQHTGMVRVINDSINRWFCCPSQASVETIVQTVRWADPPKPLAQRIRENRLIQAKIDKMQDHMLPTWLDSLNES
ncbi:MAG TPA: SCO family protein [Candidatus Sulfotelmatobacter sp.]|nr:SCO family protein [Candidatus Sulfotelmatobacter sp.]